MILSKKKEVIGKKSASFTGGKKKSIIKNFLFSKQPFSFNFYLGRFLLLTSCFLLLAPNAHAATPSRVCFDKHCLTVEAASDDATRMRGLQGRTSLAPDTGMLFVFSEEDVRNFWMKDTLIPLDMIWLDGSKRVVDVKTNVPPCIKDPCPVYVPSQKALYVLEANANYAQTHGVRLGDQAIFK